MSDSQISKPAAGAFTVEYRHGRGYAVVDPYGHVRGGYHATWDAAATQRDHLQRAADVAAKRGPRACMCCGVQFASEGIHNRLCNPCRGLGDGGPMALAAHATGKIRRAARA